MNFYEIKQQQRKERYEDLAEKAKAQSEVSYQRSKSMFDAIPFGQPILVGHYSERGDRSYRNRAGNLMNKSIELDKKANYYENRAEHMSDNISSDDPDAIEKLKIKLAKLEDRQKDMKEHNAEARANKLPQPYEKYQLTNNGAVIRGVKQRIEQLTKKQEMIVNEDKKGKNWTLHENKEENRIQFLFEGIPAQEIRTELKSRGFRWSPTNVAWQRQLNSQGRWASETIMLKLER